MSSTESTNNQKLCAVCNKPSILLCSRCRTIYYCSQDCQRSDWREHKPNCSQIINAVEMIRKDNMIKLLALSKIYFVYNDVLSSECYDLFSTTDENVYICLKSVCKKGNMIMENDFTSMLSSNETIKNNIEKIVDQASNRCDIEYTIGYLDNIIEIVCDNYMEDKKEDSKKLEVNMRNFDKKLEQKSLILMNVYYVQNELFTIATANVTEELKKMYR